jgi:hypothetical protein
MAILRHAKFLVEAVAISADVLNSGQALSVENRGVERFSVPERAPNSSMPELKAFTAKSDGGMKVTAG